MNTRSFLVLLLVLIIAVLAFFLLMPDSSERERKRVKPDKGCEVTTNGKTVIDKQPDIAQIKKPKMWEELEQVEVDYDELDRLHARTVINGIEEKERGTEGHNMVFADSDAELVTSFKEDWRNSPFPILRNTLGQTGRILAVELFPHYIVFSVSVSVNEPISSREIFDKFVSGKSIYDFNIPEAYRFKIYKLESTDSTEFRELDNSLYKVTVYKMLKPGLIARDPEEGGGYEQGRDEHYHIEVKPNEPIKIDPGYNSASFRLVYHLWIDYKKITLPAAMVLAVAADKRKVKCPSPKPGYSYNLYYFILRELQDDRERQIAMRIDINKYRWEDGVAGAEKYLLNLYQYKYRNPLPLITLADDVYDYQLDDVDKALEWFKRARIAAMETDVNNPLNFCLWGKESPSSWINMQVAELQYEIRLKEERKRSK